MFCVLKSLERRPGKPYPSSLAETSDSMVPSASGASDLERPKQRLVFQAPAFGNLIRTSLIWLTQLRCRPKSHAMDFSVCYEHKQPKGLNILYWVVCLWYNLLVLVKYLYSCCIQAKPNTDVCVCFTLWRLMLAYLFASCSTHRSKKNRNT